MTNALSGRMIALAFVAGFLATLAAHEPIVMAFGVPAYSMAKTWPFGIWEFVSLSFFGGLWGVALAFVIPRLPAPFNDWLGWLILGAILPSAVFWFVVAPLKGIPFAVVFSAKFFVGALIVNAAWGIGTWVLIKLGNMLMGRTSAA
jgi:hypothetical protein